MRTSLLRYFWDAQSLFASLLVLVVIAVLGVLAQLLPETDKTSFLDPVFDRIDFLNVEDISTDVIVAVRQLEPLDDRIVVVNTVDVEPRLGKLTTLLHRLRSYNATVVGIGFPLTPQYLARERLAGPQSVDSLAVTIAQAGNVVLASTFFPETNRPLYKPDAVLDAAKPMRGFINLPADHDEVIRSFQAYRTVAGERQASFPLAVCSVADVSLPASIAWMGEDPQVIQYSGNYEEIQSIPIDDVIQEYETPEIEAIIGANFRKLFENKIVLVGFVNEGGRTYLGGTRRTPLGIATGVEGPDMPEIFVFANVVHMLLRGDSLRPVPLLIDWSLAFLFSLGGIVLYRTLRTKPADSSGLAYLVSSLLVAGTLIVFFLPVFAYYAFHMKVSYNLSATAMLLVFPAVAAVDRVSLWLEKTRLKRREKTASNPTFRGRYIAYAQGENLSAYIHIFHGVWRALFAACAVEAARLRSHGKPVPAYGASPLGTWKALLPSVGSLFADPHPDGAKRRRAYRLLAEVLEDTLRDTRYNEWLIATETGDFNPHHYEEWAGEIAPDIERIFSEELRAFRSYRIEERQENGATVAIDGEATGEFSLAPCCEHTECKLHRTKEIFFLAAIVPRQTGIASFPFYLGATPNCEPVLRSETVDAIRELREAASATEAIADTVASSQREEGT